MHTYLHINAHPVLSELNLGVDKTYLVKQSTCPFLCRIPDSACMCMCMYVWLYAPSNLGVDKTYFVKQSTCPFLCLVPDVYVRVCVWLCAPSNLDIKLIAFELAGEDCGRRENPVLSRLKIAFFALHKRGWTGFSLRLENFAANSNAISFRQDIFGRAARRLWWAEILGKLYTCPFLCCIPGTRHNADSVWVGRKILEARKKSRSTTFVQRVKRNFQTAHNGGFPALAIFAGQLKSDQLYLVKDLGDSDNVKYWVKRYVCM
jgi:hypothetical protein